MQFYITVISLHCFHIQVEYIGSRVQQTAMLVNTREPIKCLTLHSGQGTTCDARPVGRLWIRFISIEFIQLFEPRMKLRTSYVVSKFSIYRFLLDQRKLLLNINCGVKIVMICMWQVTIESHARVICCELWYQMVCFTRFRFCTQPACNRNIFVAYEKQMTGP